MLTAFTVWMDIWRIKFFIAWLGIRPLSWGLAHDSHLHLWAGLDIYRQGSLHIVLSFLPLLGLFGVEWLSFSDLGDCSDFRRLVCVHIVIICCY